MKVEIAWHPLNWHPLTWEDLHEGWGREWDVAITFPLIAWYADMSQDANTWYTQRGSPFGPPVAPPLLLSRLGSQLTDSMGRMMGFLNTRNRTETLAPAVAGTVVRFKGRLTGKFERRGRRYISMVVDAYDAETGAHLLHEEKEYAVPPGKE
ncbi:MAG: hypothetical protein HY261_01140 [Chloroflexi bacterium]|nr:hypothetical protein [Chloroflexota bacterium]